MWLDAGETMAAEDLRSLREFVDNEADPQAVYMLMVRATESDGQTGEQAARARLMPNLPELRFSGRIRESVDQAVERCQLRWEGLPFRIQRGSEELGHTARVRKARRNLQIAQLAIDEQGPEAGLLCCLGESFQALGDVDRSLNCFREAVKASPPGSPVMLEAYYGWLTSLDESQRNRDEQISLCTEALQSFPLDAQLLCALGGYLQSQGSLDLAVRSYQTAYEYGQVDPTIWHLASVQEVALSCYCLGLQLQGQPQQAYDVLRLAAADKSASAAVRRQFLELLVKQGRREEALALAARLPLDDSSSAALQDAVRGGCLASEKDWNAARPMLQSAFDRGCRDPICLKWLTVCLLSLGEREQAQAVVDQWLLTAPHSVEAQQYLGAVQALADERQLRVDPPAAESDLRAPSAESHDDRVKG